jgi:YesN/AraC family two-component response regulator
MERNKFYLEKRLTQNELAKRLKTNTAYLSAVINEYKGTNFNNLRIDYVKEMLRTNVQWRKYSIDTIADECGFSNKTQIF